VYTPETWWACTSARSLVDMGGWAVYQSPDGLVGVNGLEFILLTEDFYDNNTWRTDYSTETIGGNSEGRYVMFYDNGPAEKGSLIFDPVAGKNALTTSDFYTDLVYHEDQTGQLLVRDAFDTLARYDSGANMTFVWRSKIHQIRHRVNFAYLEVIANSYPVNVKLMAGQNWGSLNTAVFDDPVTERYTALPSGFEYDHWSIEISDTDEVIYVGLYEDMAEVG